MPLASNVHDRVEALLEPGEELRYLFPASIPVGAWMVPHVLVAVTSRSIVVLYTGLLSATRPRGIQRRYPRDTRLGPVDLSLTPAIRIGSLLLEIDEDYVDMVHAADAELGEDVTAMPDPLPGA